MVIKLKVQDSPNIRLNPSGGDAARFIIGDRVQFVTGDPYEGPYEVTPKAHDPVILETREKVMNDNVTVLKVPYFETSNLFDGKTAYIAEES